MNLILDITTTSSVYNPLSAKGQWVLHRFGERDVNFELSVDVIETVVKSLQPSQVILESVFGDPLCHSNIGDILEMFARYHVHCAIITYGMDNLDIVSAYNCSLFIKVCNKVFLGSNIDYIRKQLHNNNNVMIENTVFKHTNNSTVKDICTTNNWQYFETHGQLLSGFCSSIIDRSGKWLYDVHSADSDRETLIQTSEAWHRLKMFVKRVHGKSILEKPDPVAVSDSYLQMLPKNTDIVVTVSGHLIQNRERAVIFSNALCEDWDSKLFNKLEQYEAYVLAVLRSFYRTDLNSISVYNTDPAEIMQSYL